MAALPSLAASLPCAGLVVVPLVAVLWGRVGVEPEVGEAAVSLCFQAGGPLEPIVTDVWEEEGTLIIHKASFENTISSWLVP